MLQVVQIKQKTFLFLAVFFMPPTKWNATDPTAMSYVGQVHRSYQILSL